MHLSVLMAFMSFAMFGCCDPGCESVPFSPDGQLYVTCKGNFTEMEKLKLLLRNVSESIRIFQLQDVILDVLPPDVFDDGTKPKVRKVVFDNVSIELLEVPELGSPPLESIRDTVNSLEIHNTSKVFAWDLPSLHLNQLENLIIQNSQLISITIPFFFWPQLRFIQIQNCNLRWIHFVAFQGNKMLTILSLAQNEIAVIRRSMFPKPAAHLYSIDLSFNRLEEFPENIFSEMDALQELKLDNNKLKFFNQNLFKQIWNNLKMLWIEGNQIPCETLCWMSDRTEKPLFLESAECKLSNKFIFLNEYFENCSAQIQP